MNFSKKIFFVAVTSFILFFSFINYSQAGYIHATCRCDGGHEEDLGAEDEDLLLAVCRRICSSLGGGGILGGEFSCETDDERIEGGRCVSTSTGEEEKAEAEKSTVKAIELESPIEDTDIVPLIGRVIKTALGVVGAVALLMFIYGGLYWLTSGGSPDKIKKGMDVLIWAAIGLVVIFAGYTLVDFVFEAFGV